MRRKHLIILLLLKHLLLMLTVGVWRRNNTTMRHPSVPIYMSSYKNVLFYFQLRKIHHRHRLHRLLVFFYSLLLNNFGFVSKGSLNIPEYRCLLIGRVKCLYTIEHAVENIAFHRFQSISVTLLSLL